MLDSPATAFSAPRPTQVAEQPIKPRSAARGRFRKRRGEHRGSNSVRNIRRTAQVGMDVAYSIFHKHAVATPSVNSGIDRLVMHTHKKGMRMASSNTERSKNQASDDQERGGSSLSNAEVAGI